MTRPKSQPPSVSAVRSAALPGRVLDLKLEGVPSHEAYGRVLAAVDAGRLTLTEAEKLVAILYKGLVIQDSKLFADKIDLVEAKAMEAARIAGRALAAPSQRLVEARLRVPDPDPEGVARGG
jgi:hypothetical protein